MMIGNVVRVNKITLICLGLVLIGVIYLLSSLRTQTMAIQFSSSKLHKTITWHNQEFVDIPEGLHKMAKQIRISEEEVELDYNSETVVINTRETVPQRMDKMDILLLHGAAFSSKTWQDIGTLQFLAAAGYRAIAVDLPGKGKSSKVPIKDEGDFLEKLVDMLDMIDPVIISPSMSGMYSLPYLLTPGTPGLRKASGFVPIAPVATELYTNLQFENVKIPTMIVRGSKDTGLGTVSTKHLKFIPNSELFVLEGAGHAAYMSHTTAFHRLLYNFLLSVTSIHASAKNVALEVASNN